MTVAETVALWYRTPLYKALACVVLALIALQYLLSSGLDHRSVELIFTVNGSRYGDYLYRTHQRGLIIYGQATTANYSGIVNASVPSETVPPSVVAPRNSSLNNNNNNATRPTVGVTNATELPVLQGCPLIPPNLVGPVLVIKNLPDSSVMEKQLADVKKGGRGWPSDCMAHYRVAIIIPYRNRPQHLQTWLYNLHPILLRQQIYYQIFVVEQEGKGKFNRAMLMNVGYEAALRERDFDCFIFHDVDLLPEDDRNLYTCPEQPRHMSVAVDQLKYRLPYADIFGGVSALSKEHFRLVNGFSNAFWGWGGEDDDMANRIKARGLHISRYPANIARYKMLSHKKEKANPERYEILRNGKKRFSTDGLSDLQYELVEKKHLKLYTWLLVRLTPPQPS